MKPLRFLLTIAGASALLVFTPACEMQSASVTVPGYAEKEKAKAETAGEPETANPEPPKYFEN